MRAFKTELDLNNAQVTACRQHAGAACYAYNWGLARKQEAYRATGTSPSAIELHRELNALKNTDVCWIYDVSTYAPREAPRTLDSAFAHFFRRCALKRDGKLTGTLSYPQPKTKNQGVGSFRLTGSIAVFPDAIQLPRLGRLRLTERGYVPATGTARIKGRSATVSAQARSLVRARHHRPRGGRRPGGKALATRCEGTTIPHPRPLTRRREQLKRMHRALSCTPNGSRNHPQAARTLAKQSRTVATQRASTRQQVTTRRATTTSVRVIADRYVAGLRQNRRLAQAIADIGFGACRRHLTDKAAWYGSQVEVVSRWEPSSTTCSGCGGNDDDLQLSVRGFGCRTAARPDCGLVRDRDRNAAIKLSTLAGSVSQSRTPVAWGALAAVARRR
jgi:putative transposase